MMALMLDIQNKGYLIGIAELDGVYGLNANLIDLISTGKIPDKLHLNGQIRKLIIPQIAKQEKLQLKRGTRLIIPRNNSDIVILIDLVRELVPVSSESQVEFHFNDRIYSRVSLTRLIQGEI